jgi:hypothetical protein
MPRTSDEVVDTADVRPGAQAPERLAQAIPHIRRHQPSDRWSADRLGPVISGWYEMVLGYSGPAADGERSAEVDVPA